MTSIPALALKGPDHVVAALPFLLGFTPHESVVVVWTTADRVLLTQRVDLPASDASIAPHAFARELVRPLEGHRPEAAILIIIGSPDSPSESPAGADVVAPGAGAASSLLTIPNTELATAIMESIVGMGIELRDALYVHGGHFWSYRCDSECCPPEGNPIDPVAATAVAASFAVRGVSVMESREALVAALEADADGVARIEPLIVDREIEIDALLGTSHSPALEAWRDVHIEWVHELVISGSCPSDTDTVTLLVALCDVRVRDTLLWHIARTEHRYGCADVLLSATRLAPNGYVAPVATCAALACWLLGDGARASISIARALNDDPEYSLALMIGASLAAGLPPAAWGEVMAELTLDDCRGRPPAA